MTINLFQMLPGWNKAIFPLVFGYLICFRIWHDCAQTHGILMQMALRVISLTVDLQNRACGSQAKINGDSCVHCSLARSPTLKALGYLWCYVGLLLTPAIRFNTYEHFIEGRFEAPHKRRKELFLELIEIVAAVVPIALMTYFLVPANYSQSSDFLAQSFWFKLLYIAAMSFSFRCRLQVGIMLGEASAIALGLGVYPGNMDCAPESGPYRVGQNFPSDVNTATVFGVRPSVELEVTLRDFVIKWNRTVQCWLVRCFYKQFSGPRTVRLLYVFLLSGFWHGNGIGHWLFFVQVAIYILVGEAGFTGSTKSVPYLIKLLIHNIAFGYWHLPYLILDTSKTWQIYSSLYFCGHVLILISIAAKSCRGYLHPEL
ncbi:lysophospholipid acyltransferase 7-like [Galendromus occidentalis]|uniref:Lysophospholipid acyltransferase 7 n=1 Tax=Galendromus occidentalis TaxID=34638 RepID=A0AAJ6QXZ7_9ACAR|nr:lysophospholipid acyltransferase 7-like [Galendromus occidentalis]